MEAVSMKIPSITKKLFYFNNIYTYIIFFVLFFVIMFFLVSIGLSGGSLLTQTLLVDAVIIIIIFILYPNELLKINDNGITLGRIVSKSPLKKDFLDLNNISYFVNTEYIILNYDKEEGGNKSMVTGNFVKLYLTPNDRNIFIPYLREKMVEQVY